MDAQAGADKSAVEQKGRTLRGGVVRVVVVALVLAALYFLGGDLARYVPRFANWVEGLGVWGPVVFGAAYAVATVAMVPGSLLTLAAGAVFGLAIGFVTVFVAAAVGATLAFLVGRYVARAWVEQRLEGHDKFGKIDRAIGDEGLKIAFLLRLSPVFPFNMLNYALGLTRISLRDYVIAHLGMVPGTLLYVYYGRAAGAVAEVAGGVETERGTGYYVVLGLGLLATVVLTTIVTRIATRSLRGATDEP